MAEERRQVCPRVGFGSSWAGSKRECGGEQAACGLVMVAQERRGGPLVAGLCGRGREVAGPLGLRGRLGQKREKGRMEFSFSKYLSLFLS